MTESPPAWTRLFPDQDFSFRFGFAACPPADFFGTSPGGAELLKERARWLDAAPDRYCALRPGGEPILREGVRQAVKWTGLRDLESGSVESLGRRWEPDFILLRPEGGRFVVVGGCVCFPSSWRLEDKLGRPMMEVHQPVPGLNERHGAAIDRYLAGLRAEPAMVRANWGLSASSELNHHPDRRLPGMDVATAPRDVCLRIEHQALVGLPETGGVLFGIRLEIVPLIEVVRFPFAARGLRRALATMPDGVLAYKGLAVVRDVLVPWLDAAGP